MYKTVYKFYTHQNFIHTRSLFISTFKFSSSEELAAVVVVEAAVVTVSDHIGLLSENMLKDYEKKDFEIFVYKLISSNILRRRVVFVYEFHAPGFQLNTPRGFSPADFLVVVVVASVSGLKKNMWSLKIQLGVSKNFFKVRKTLKPPTLPLFRRKNPYTFGELYFTHTK